MAKSSTSDAPGETSHEGISQGPVSVPIDISRARSAYSNFCRVTGTPEELDHRLGLNAQPQPMPSGADRDFRAIVLNYYTAKRLLGALHMSVQRHEAAFGVLEIDIQKGSSGAH